jgi:dissimilatory sulfite reductase (desulfoviridin) alpha/beta subunit
MRPQKNAFIMNVIDTIRTIWTNQGQDGQDMGNARKNIGILTFTDEAQTVVFKDPVS